ncbi:MAG: hypothetical protein K6G23_02090 [Lachnospiraceae bacterium]|nr:hypothetical protein [Lachnospiraceae bacterium]
MKIKKLYIRITLFVVIATAIAILALSIISSGNIYNIMKKSAENTMSSTVSSSMDLLNQYVDTQFAYLDSYMASEALTNLMAKGSSDAAAVAAAQAQTELFAGSVENLDSICFTDYGGTAVVHTMPALIGYRNDEETIEMLNTNYYNDTQTPVSAAVALVSPATGDISFLIMKSGYTSAGDPSGYVAFTVTSAGMNEILSQINLCTNQEIYLFGASDASIIYSNNADLITTTYEGAAFTDLLAQVAESGELTSGNFTYNSDATGEKMLGSYITNPALGWVLVVGADQDELYGDAAGAQRQIILIGILILIVISIILALIIKGMTNPITAIQKTLTRVSKRDLKPAKEIAAYQKRADEIGELSRATDDVINMFSEVVDVLKSCSNSLNENTLNLDETSKQLVSVTTENASVADKLSGSIERTGSSLSAVNDEIDKIVSYLDEVSQKVDSGMKQSEDIIRSSAATNEKISDVIQTNTTSLDETMNNMQSALESLKAVEKINELADAIMDITSQTNLLSLNASIEAARAGESGRGFAVVAGEIGQLANQSRDTAMNIQSIVDESNRSVANVRDQVIHLMDYVKTELIGSFTLFEDQSKQYDESISEIRDAVRAIGDAVNELSHSVDGIAKEINEINNASSDNNSGVDEIVNKNEETSNVTKDIEHLAVTSRESADSLVNVVNQFHV